MTLLVVGYKSKKQMKTECIGKPLNYRETSLFGPEYKRDGSFSVASRPSMGGGPREFFARVTMRNGLIEKVD